jgi:hypothetical protein
MRLFASVDVDCAEHGGRAGHGRHIFIHICEALACRDKRSRAYRRATGDLFDKRRGGLHPQLHVGAAAERLLEPTAISGVTALLPLTTL